MRTSGWFAALGIAGSLVSSATPAQEPRPAPVFPSGVEIITVDAVVLDDDQRPVRGLTRDDFLLFEDGQPQAIASFEAFDEDAQDAPAPVAQTTAVATPRPPSSGQDLADLPLRAMAHVLEDRPDGTARVLVTVEADVRRLANLGGGDVPRSVVSLSIATTHRQREDPTTGRTPRRGHGA